MTGAVATNLLRAIGESGALRRGTESGTDVGPREAGTIISAVGTNFTRSQVLAALDELATLSPRARGRLTDADIARLRTTANETPVENPSTLTQGFFRPERPSVRVPELLPASELEGLERTVHLATYRDARAALQGRYDRALVAFDAAVARGETGEVERSEIEDSVAAMDRLNHAARRFSNVYAQYRELSRDPTLDVSTGALTRTQADFLRLTAAALAPARE